MKLTLSFPSSSPLQPSPSLPPSPFSSQWIPLVPGRTPNELNDQLLNLKLAAADLLPTLPPRPQLPLLPSLLEELALLLPAPTPLLPPPLLLLPPPSPPSPPSLSLLQAKAPSPPNPPSLPPSLVHPLVRFEIDPLVQLLLPKLPNQKTPLSTSSNKSYQALYRVRNPTLIWSGWILEVCRARERWARLELDG